MGVYVKRYEKSISTNAIYLGKKFKIGTAFH